MRSPTKGQAILNEAKMRLEAARMRMHLAQSQLNTAQEVFRIQTENYEALEKSLARAPRKVTKNPAKDTDADGAAERARKIIAPEELCGKPDCGQLKGHPNHDDGYLSSHPFVPTVGKKSGRKTRAQQSEVNFETEKDAVTNAAGVASGGD